MEDVYRKLIEYLDRLPGGFPPSETGADVELLQCLFTPEEAALAVHLTLDEEDARTIAERAGLPPAEVAPRLEEMARKGLIFPSYREDGPTLYHAVPFVVGIYEFQLNRLGPDLMQRLGNYWSTRARRPPHQTIPQMRTIPVGESIDVQVEAMPYEQIDELIAAHDRYAVAPCICRRSAKMGGDGCDAPEESCLLFGDWADYYVRTGRGRAIDRAELAEILARADEANLVLQPSNSRDIKFVCCCCGCCCGILRGLQHHPRPAEVVGSAFIAQLDVDTCIGCWTCLDRCQMQALSEDGDQVLFNRDRCIGCGLCVSTCTSGALTLVRKPETERTRVPATMNDTWHTISEAQTRMW